MKANEIVIPVTTLIVGAALGFALKPSSAPVAEEETAPAVASAGEQPRLALDQSGALESLRQENARLRRQLAAAKSAAAEPSAEASAEETPVAREGNGPIDHFMSYLEDLEKRHPERYAAMTNEWAQAGRRFRDFGRERLSYFDSLDLSGMPEVDRQAVQNHKELLAMRDNLIGALQEATNEERRELGPKMGEVMRAINQSNGAVREALIRESAAKLGLKDVDAGRLAGTVQEIFRATSEGGMGGFGGRGGRGGPGGNGGGPRGGRRDRGGRF